MKDFLENLTLEEQIMILNAVDGKQNILKDIESVKKNLKKIKASDNFLSKFFRAVNKSAAEKKYYYECVKEILDLNEDAMQDFKHIVESKYSSPWEITQIINWIEGYDKDVASYCLQTYYIAFLKVHGAFKEEELRKEIISLIAKHPEYKKKTPEGVEESFIEVVKKTYELVLEWEEEIKNPVLMV